MQSTSKLKHGFLLFVIGISLLIRHSDFVIRHSLAGWVFDPRDKLSVGCHYIFLNDEVYFGSLAEFAKNDYV